jgi:hypothetical protein
MQRHLDRRTTHLWLAAVLVLAVAACSGGLAGGGSPSPVPQPSTCSVIESPTPTSEATGGCGEAMSPGALRVFLGDELGPLWFCDPDSYPVGRDEQQSAIDRYPEMVAEHDVFEVVARRLQIDPETATGAQKLAIYRLWKAATAISLEPIGDDRYRFDYLAAPPAGAAQGTRTAGVIDARGAITIEQQAAAGEPMCPICLDRATTIDTADGPVRADALRLGDPVWTLDRDGRHVAGTVIALGSTAAPEGHRVVRVTLSDGRSTTASPGHPLADGRTLGTLRVGDLVDGSTVAALETLDYEGRETFDLVVSGETGIYLAGGIPFGSTLD